MKGPAAFSFWVALVFFPAADLAEDPRWPEAAALAAVTACYLLSVRAAFGRPAAAPAARVALAGLAGVVLAGCTAYGGTWLYLCPLVSIACVLVLRGRAVPAALSAVTAASMAVAFATGGGQDAAGAVAWGTAAAGVAVHVTLELYRTRRELAEAAVGAERERFSRDLHDLLGHTLSLMVVKAEAVRRLAPRDPSSAARQAAEIEEIGRRALTEVRAAVSGYRGARAGRRAGRRGRGPARGRSARDRHRRRGTARAAHRRPARLGRTGGGHQRDPPRRGRRVPDRGPGR
ncbi:histidine kinase dimerization/phosphoacceptor domain-containing protein [Planomonospora venezuelensis]|uniref:sensor histidine kinase n=1 Tax=Planomonospora venezuelensis TaxID=1999 RepID=UPI0031E9CD1F